MLEHWRELEADFRRFYRVRPLECSWRWFETYLGGLPADSALLSSLEAEREEREAWRRELGRVTGRDYSKPAQRMTIGEFANARR